VEMGQGNPLRYLQIFTNLPIRNKGLPISLLGSLLNQSIKTAITTNMLLQRTPAKLRDSEKILWFISKNTYVILKSEL
jgi:nucleoid-associated protein YejK